MANRIRQLRHERKLTLEEVARKAGTSPQHLSRLEGGTRRLTDDWMHRIGAALSVPPADLLVRRRIPDEAELVESREELLVLRWWRRMDRTTKFQVITFARGLGQEIKGVRVAVPPFREKGP